MLLVGRRKINIVPIEDDRSRQVRHGASVSCGGVIWCGVVNRAGYLHKAKEWLDEKGDGIVGAVQLPHRPDSFRWKW